jgi:DNA polymerase III sliding clamp (beta) subunit (PCNA family)
MELKSAAHQRPHLDLIANIQQENRQLRALESENKELKIALEEHQNTLELIMSKYRQQVSKLLEAGYAKSISVFPLEDSAILVHQAEKINSTMAVMRVAAQTDDEFACKEAELFSRLTTENQGLKELLDIGLRHGSVGASGPLRVQNLWVNPVDAASDH